MNLRVVAGRGFYFICVGCGQRKLSHDPSLKAIYKNECLAYADIEGKAFEDFYCEECVGKMSQMHTGGKHA